MNRLVFVSDTHGRREEILDSLTMIRAMKPDLLVHLGDFQRDAALFSEKLRLSVVSVPGNCDLSLNAAERVLEFGRHRLFICHGHTLSVKSGTDRLLRRAKELACDAALFGHTHIPISKKQDGILLLNPGSLGYAPETGTLLCIGVLEAEGEKLEAALL